MSTLRSFMLRSQQTTSQLRTGKSSIHIWSLIISHNSYIVEASGLWTANLKLCFHSARYAKNIISSD